MTAGRLDKQEFFAKVDGFDAEALRKMVWTLYYRGSAAQRERIEDMIAPPAETRVKPKKPGVDLGGIREFVALAREGAYFGGDRRVSPKQRTRWRFTFSAHASSAVGGLGGPNHADAAIATELMIDLACATKDYEYFRSEEPLEAARFVVSDAVEALWSTTLALGGFGALCATAPDQLGRWESRYGWTRRGFGKVSERERSLAGIAAALLNGIGEWGPFADEYLYELESGGRHGLQRREDLDEWHVLLMDRLWGTDYQDRLDRIADSRVLDPTERKFLRARLAHRNGDDDQARTLIGECLAKLPGHHEFRDFADMIS
ncbi:hypothetical protein HH308_11340 [Gordonia sp. TBRC 11910]|uniref:Uncharacterized protein n=1 Tax=Gordonia asplenii TaxID=2725283 RepID=A0A848KUV2_9ACTN|nr:hypothetical protein [Gordonia asplenii]NMO01807.1 hypothetical protein [Gordonia asplenii]